MNCQFDWLSDIVDNTINDHAFWQNAFQQMEQQAYTEAKSMEGPFRFYGEIDCPEEMLRYPTVTLEQVQQAGKANWISDKNNNFFTVGDATMEELFDAGKIVRGPRPESEYDRLRSIEAKIHYRVDHQHISERMAREIVGDECGEILFDYTFAFEVIEINDNNGIDDYPARELKSTIDIHADDETEARKILEEYHIRPVGTVISQGYNYATKTSYKISVIENKINLLYVDTTEFYQQKLESK